MNANIISQYVKIRQKIHQNPELLYDVHETAELVDQTLKSLGYKTETGIGKTGVCAILDSKKPGKTVALRADMDALPLEELNDLPYKSQNPGKMHACGHDGHTASLLATADILRSRTDDFKGKIKFIFQPAEEGGAGAKAMIDDGVLQGVDAIFGYHNHPGKTHVIATKPGPFMASADHFSITLTGKGGHAAYPHLTRDLIYVGAQIVQALQAIASRFADQTDSIVVTIAKFDAGTTFNVIPDKANMLGTIRASDEKSRLLAKKYLYKTCETLAALNEVECKIEYTTCYPVTFNHSKEAELVLAVAKRCFGDDQVEYLTTIGSMGAEDFSFYLEEIPGSYFFIGNGEVMSLHSSTYNYNDEIIPTAVKVMSETAIAYLNADYRE